MTRSGPIRRTIGAVAQGLTGVARLARTPRSPRVTVYDRAGHPRLVEAGTSEHAPLVETATRLVELARGPRSGAASSPADGGESP